MNIFLPPDSGRSIKPPYRVKSPVQCSSKNLVSIFNPNPKGVNLLVVRWTMDVVVVPQAPIIILMPEPIPVCAVMLFLDTNFFAQVAGVNYVALILPNSVNAAVVLR